MGALPLFPPRGISSPPGTAAPAERGARAAHTFPGVLQAPGTLINVMVKLIGVRETVVDNESTLWRSI